MKLFDSEKSFFKGNLHTHTTNSDGRKSPEEALKLYQANGYDFIALTDHWKRTTSEAHMYGNMLVMPGIEVDYTLPAQVVHIVGVGIHSDIEESVRREGPQGGIDAIRKAGGRAILAHPAWSLNTPETIQAMRGLVAAEIYNTVSGVPWNGDRADSTGILDIAANNGCVLNTVAGDDTHFYTGEECKAYIMLQAESLTQENVLRALDAGAFYATCGPRFEQIEVTEDEIRVNCSEVCRAIFHSDLYYVNNRTVTAEAATQFTYKLNRARGERYVRVILIDKAGNRAWSNPILL